MAACLGAWHEENSVINVKRGRNSNRQTERQKEEERETDSQREGETDRQIEEYLEKDRKREIERRRERINQNNPKSLTPLYQILCTRILSQ